MMTRLCIAFLAVIISGGFAAAQDIQGHYRPRPPEMTVQGKDYSGPIKEIADQAVTSLGMTITWDDVPFARSLKELADGAPVLVPRFNRTTERESFAIFLGPIAIQKREIVFAVRKGDEHKVTKYEDLVPLAVAIKRGTTYFEPFDHDPAIKKTIVNDDENLVVQLKASRFDVAALIDPASFRTAATAAGWDGWTLADWHKPTEQGNYFAVSKTGPLAARAAELDAKLKAMAADGTVKKIYAKFGLDPEKIE